MKPKAAIAKGGSNVKKIPKEPPVARTHNVDKELRELIGVNVDQLNAAQKATYDKFMEAFHSIDHNPLAERSLMSHHHGIPNNPQFASFNVEKSTEKMKSNTASVSTSYVNMVRDMYRKLLIQYEQTTSDVKVEMQTSAVRFEDPRFQSYFEAAMARLKTHHKYVPQCNDNLALLLDKFRKKNKRISFVPADQIPIVTNPTSQSRLSNITECYSVQMIEMLLLSVADNDLADISIREARCCMRGDQCLGKMLYNKFNLHTTSTVPDIMMYRMRPYIMLAANTWDGENPYINCFWCVHDLFWAAAIDNVAISRPQSVIQSTPFVKAGDGDPTAFPKHLCADMTHPWLKNVANVAHPILIPNIGDHFTYRDGGFKFNGSRFL